VVQSVYLRQQAGRSAVWPAIPPILPLRDSLFKLADEYAARASARETDTAARQAGPLDQDGA
jgi:hypothetical protein